MFDKLKEYVLTSCSDRAIFSFVNDHDYIWIWLKQSLANNFVDATLVMSVFHFVVCRPIPILTAIVAPADALYKASRL